MHITLLSSTTLLRLVSSARPEFGKRYENLNTQIEEGINLLTMKERVYCTISVVMVVWGTVVLIAAVLNSCFKII